MKKLLFLAALAAASLLCTPPARADVGVSSMGITNRVLNGGLYISGGTSGNSNGIAISLDKVDAVALQFAGKGTNASCTTALDLYFVRSMDGTTYETYPTFKWSVVPNGSTAFVAFTNLDSSVIGACQYLKLSAMTNGNANYMITNMSLNVIKKTIKPSP